MTLRTFILAAAACCLGTVAPGAGRVVLPPLLEVSFDAHQEGAYADGMVRRDWGSPKWIALYDRAQVVTVDGWVGGRCLQIKYPEGAVGPRAGGAQFLLPIEPADEYYLDYYLMFRKGFDFKDGGKLPGLCGGKCNTGGNVPTGDGWSARYMFGKGGALIGYIYHMDQPVKWGDALKCKVKFEHDRWYRLTQRVKVNTPGEKDGIIQIWIDGTFNAERTNYRFRDIEGARVDHFYFSTFHGGGGPRYAPANDSYICYDHFRIATTPETIFAYDLRTLAAQRARRKKKRATPLKIAAPKVRRAKADAVAAWDQKLQERLRETVAAGEKVAFYSASMRQRMTVVSVDDEDAIRVRGGPITTDVSWGRLSTGEKASLAAAIHDEGNVEDSLMVAFYLLVKNDESGARGYLMKAGEMAPLIEEFFE